MTRVSSKCKRKISEENRMFLTNIIQLTALGYDYAKLFDKFMELKMIQI